MRRAPVPARVRLPNLTDVTVVPSRLHVKRVATSWEGGAVRDRPLLAMLTVLEQGGYSAPIVTRGKKHPTARLASRKTGERQVLEGPSEIHLGKNCEVDWEVRDWKAHPLVFEFVYDGKRFVYHLDLMFQMRDGRIFCIEAKRTERDLRDPDYLLKLACVKEICRRIGWEFEVRYKNDITGGSDRMKNVERLFSQVYLHVDEREEAAMRLFEAEASAAEWGSLRDRLSTSRVRGDALLLHMVTRQRLAVDLDLPFVPETVVRSLGMAPAVPTMRI